MTRTRVLLAATFTYTGVMHFVRPKMYEAIMPPQLPAHKELVAISGVVEIVGGLSVLPARTRRLARWFNLGWLAAVFPANVYMALHPDEVAERGVPADRIPRALLYLRLPIQGLFALWVWRATSDD